MRLQMMKSSQADCHNTENMSEKSDEFLSKQLLQIKSMIPQRDQLNPSVSKVDIAWHLDHILKVINSIYDMLKHSNPRSYEADINIRRLIIFTAGKIPRGRGKSPKSVLPQENILTAGIKTQLEMARNNVIALDFLDENQYFKHFGFGTLNRDKAKRFLEIHTDHHLSIINDILKK